MAQTQTRKLIPLESNSVYITTISLLNGAFHWALIYVDEVGKISRHQWALNPEDASGPEAYFGHDLIHGAFNHTHNDTILGYFKILDCPAPSRAYFESMCAAVFPTSHYGVEANRRAGISCRTFVTGVLVRLLPAQRVQQIEAAVIQQSTTCGDTYTTSFLWNRPYETITSMV
ncbi:hypothetical protein FA95DRAFT_1591061 [Auriscalpium vulgare]|uniref:Uncharacterized protein n=1 Tax=Auriscalpium vulgare TaxID=40419 RepID=A0ACB8RD07_9AGAM|nr:hypothetical protein FA95DRAFT_1591061 [Auriscalpium vulgare]